jgi:hypothetical protein
MRWSRLLLGREFELTEMSLLRIWDYMFACIFDAELSLRVSGAHHKDGTSSHAHASLRKQHSSSSSSQKESKAMTAAGLTSPEASRQPSDPLSGALFDRGGHGEQEDEEDEEEEGGKEESHLLRREGRDSDDTDDDDILWTTSSAVIKTSSRFGPSSALLNALSDFMLAMLLHVCPLLLLLMTP